MTAKTGRISGGKMKKKTFTGADFAVLQSDCADASDMAVELACELKEASTSWGLVNAKANLQTAEDKAAMILADIRAMLRQVKK